MTNAQSTVSSEEIEDAVTAGDAADVTAAAVDPVTEQETTIPTDRKTLILDAISFISRFGLAITWIWAGIHKVGNVMETGQSIQAYQIFTTEWSVFLADIIGPLELAGGLILLIGVFFRQAGWVSTFVLVLFIIGIGQAWSRGLVIDCGCFGDQNLTDGGMDYLQTILRDVVLIAMSIWTAYRPFKRFAIYP